MSFEHSIVHIDKLNLLFSLFQLKALMEKYMSKLKNTHFYNALVSRNLITPQALMTIEILTIELLASYALAHH